MKITACLIVKNEEQLLAQTLPNLQRYLDEIILVNTGSSDNTVAVARQYGAQVCHFAWCDDFAAARNESLKHATGDWVLWVDADEYLTGDDLKAMRTLLENAAAPAYEVTMYESGLDQCEKKFNYQRVKLFKNGAGYHFVRPINEQLIDGAGRTASGPRSTVAIYHWGKALAAARMAAKRAKYIELYSRGIEQDPADPYYHFLLAQVLDDSGRLAEALDHYCRVGELSTDRNIVRQSKEKIAQLRLRLKDGKGALQAARELLAYDPENIAARNVLGALLLLSRRADDVIELMTEVLQRKIAGPVESPYQALAMPNFLLSKAYEAKGDRAQAAACLARAKEFGWA